METMTALVTADFKRATSTSAAPTESAKPGLLQSLIASWKRARADRRLCDSLAEMDRAMLLDIGVGEDEIYLVRSRTPFTPRAWLERNPATRHLVR